MDSPTDPSFVDPLIETRERAAVERRLMWNRIVDTSVGLAVPFGVIGVWILLAIWFF
jgi:hypothetical protein